MNLDVAPLLDRGLSLLAATNCRGAANREHSQIMWQAAGDILQHGWLQLRAREKPRGYAGDHEMLGAIYQSRVTTDPLGVSFDRYFLRQAAPQTVRNRMNLVRSLVANRVSKASQKIVVIGSGAGLEIAAALQTTLSATRENSEFWLLDLDPAAIELAWRNLGSLVPQQNLHCLAENLVRLPKKQRLLEQLQNADLVICTGFFDYLEEEAAASLLRSFWNILRPSGQAMIFNFAPWNPTRAYMEWIGNWYLIYRTREDLARLAINAEIPANDFEISAESSGVGLLLRVTKPA